MRTLVVAEHDGADLRQASLSCLTFARETAEATGGDVSWLVLGNGVGDVAEEAARYAPAIAIDHPGLASPIAEPFARALSAIAKSHRFDLIAAASSTFAKDVLPRAAAQLGGVMASDVVRHEWTDGTLLLDCPRFAGAVTATVRLIGSPQVMTIRASSYSAAEPGGRNLVETVNLDESTFACRTRYEGLQSKKTLRPDVTESQIVVSGGRAFKSSEDFERLVGGLADVLGGATGSSRALVDAGITPNELQVGQTGKIIAPQLYVALGISGAVQHLAGMKNSKTIVAINKDPDAPIFDVADVGLVGDVYSVVPELIEKLEHHAAAVSR